MEKIFKIIRQLIADKEFEKLAALEIKKPQAFNWVKELFEGIHVHDTPDNIALLWTDGNAVIPFSFSKISRLTNQVVNFLRHKGVQQNDTILTQIALQPITRFSKSATIKGGFS